MKTYKVSVCCFGYVTIRADSEDKAKIMAGKLLPEQVHWLGERENVPNILALYVEKQEE